MNFQIYLMLSVKLLLVIGLCWPVNTMELCEHIIHATVHQYSLTHSIRGHLIRGIIRGITLVQPPGQGARCIGVVALAAGLKKAGSSRSRAVIDEILGKLPQLHVQSVAYLDDGA